MKNARAVLFGISYEHFNEDLYLPGCCNDTFHLLGYLVNKRDYPLERIAIITDVGPTFNLARRSGILYVLEEFAKQTKEEKSDEVFISMSCHAVRTIGDRGQTVSAILPIDCRSGGWIDSGTINRKLNKINPETKVICSFDCCHSGSLAQLRYEYTYDRDSKEVRFREIDEGLPMIPHVYTISACRDDEEANDIEGFAYESYSGVLSSLLIRALSELPSPTVSDVFLYIHGHLHSLGIDQSPVLHSSRPVLPSDRF